MDLFPAIDLRGGRCVRLLRGDYAAETVYDDDPAARACSFEAAGAPWIHVVDLDAARSGDLQNLDAVAAICAAVSRPVQVGGGVRSVEAAQRLFDAGATRVVVGTAAVEDPRLVSELARRAPGRVAVGLHVPGNEVAVRGWTQSSGVSALDAARRLGDAGASALVVTRIDVDGTLEGPDLDLYVSLLTACPTELVASGGVGTLDDLRALAVVDVDGRRLSGAIVGRALYEGRFGVEEAVRACSQSG